MASYQELMLPMKILDWIDINKLELSKMSLNENAVPYLNQHNELINWKLMCKNKNAIHLIKIAMEEKYDHEKNEISTLISWLYLSENENAIELLEQNIEQIDWYYLSCNRNGIKILKYYTDYIVWAFLCEQEIAAKWIYEQYTNIKDEIHWESLCENQSIEAIKLLENNKDKINYTLLSGNRFAEHLFKDNLDKICYNYLSSNESIWAMNILKNHLDKANWLELSTNYYAIDILKNNIDKIFWCDFCINKNPKAIPIIKENLFRLRKMDWSILSTNENAIEILKENQDKISFRNLTYNPGIFKIDYETIKSKISLIKEDIIKKALHPKRFTYYLNNYCYDICNDEYDNDV